MSRSGRAAAIAVLTLAISSTAAVAQAVPTIPTCNRGVGFTPYTAPAGHPDAGTVYPASGPCRMTQYNPVGTPNGTIMLIAAGGWLSHPAYTATPQVGRMAKVWTDAGYQMIAVEVTSAVVNGVGGGGPTQYSDVIQWFDVLRYYSDIYFGASYKVCTSGGSSGGHMALMVATLRLPDCIVVEAAPTDLNALTGGAQTYAVNAFGAANLTQWSPNTHTAPYFGMPILMGTLSDDPFVPVSHMTSFASTHPTATTTTLTPTGGTPPECSNYATYIERTFAHLCDTPVSPGTRQAGVTSASINAWRAQEVAFVNAVP